MRHPDEGTIHAWLDGALPPAEGSALEAHVTSCAECAAAVAEARGMLAAASRILSALDDVPGGVIPAAAPADATRVAPGRASAAEVRPFRFRAARWQVAAGLMIAVAGSWLVLRNDGARDMVEVKAADTSMAEVAPAAEPVVPERAGAVERVAATAPVAASPRVGRPGSRMETTTTASVGPALAAGAGSGTGDAAADVAPTPRRADVGGGTSVPGYAQVGQAATIGAGAQATFDSLLAVDSVHTGRISQSLGANVIVAEQQKSMAGVARARRVAPSSAPTPPPASADMAVEALRRESVSVPAAIAAAGCYAVDAVRWSPPLADSVVQSVFPQRFVLEGPSGSPADSGGQWLARPVASGGGVPSRVSGSWSLLGTDRLRVRFEGDAGRAALTLARAIGGWRGVARLSAGADGPISRGDVVVRQVGCEPPGPGR